MKTTNWLALLATIFSSVSLTAAAAEDTGTIKDKRVNVRGQARLNSEVVTQMKKDEPVTILEEIPVTKPKKGEPAKWYKIRLPSNTPVWVSTQFIHSADKTVTSSKLNVRSGPGEQFSVLARLEKGDRVKEIRVVGDWMEIEAPASSFAYVAADYVGRAETISAAPDAKPVVAAPAPVVVETVKLEPAPALVFTPPPAPAPAPVPAPTPAVVVPPTPQPSPVAVPAPTLISPVVVAEPEKRGFWSFLQPDKKNRSQPAKAVTAAKSTPPPVVETEPLSPRIVTREGIVRRSYNLQSPTFYELESLDNGKLINYLSSNSTNLPWKAVVGRTVLVTGEEAVDKRWPNTPVLKIETLKTTP